MTAADPWQTAEIAGPKKASVITKPAMVLAVISRAQHPVLLIGHNAVTIDIGGRKLIDYLLDLARVKAIPVIATGHANRAFEGPGVHGRLHYACRRGRPPYCRSLMERAETEGAL